jgi:hypothetical protein
MFVMPVKCPKCETENRNDARFCKSCGMILSQTEVGEDKPNKPIKPNDAVICQNCGEANKEGAKFCKKCGKPLIITGGPGIKSQGVSAPSESLSVKPMVSAIPPEAPKPDIKAKAKKHKLNSLAVLIPALIIVIGGVGFAFYHFNLFNIKHYFISPVSTAKKPVFVSKTLLFDNFTKDSSLNTKSWKINGKLGSKIVENLSSPQAAIIKPLLGFSKYKGLIISGVNSSYKGSSIQTIKSFSPPFTVETYVYGAKSNGNPFVLTLASSNNKKNKVINILGNVNPGNGKYYGIWVIRKIEKGRYPNYVGMGLPSKYSKIVYSKPNIKGWYLLKVVIDSSGKASIIIKQSGKKRIGYETFGIGKGHFHIILAQFEGLPYTVGPNKAYWKWISIKKGSYISQSLLKKIQLILKKEKKKEALTKKTSKSATYVYSPYRKPGYVYHENYARAALNTFKTNFSSAQAILSSFSPEYASGQSSIRFVLLSNVNSFAANVTGNSMEDFTVEFTAAVPNNIAAPTAKIVSIVRGNGIDIRNTSFINLTSSGVYTVKMPVNIPLYLARGTYYFKATVEAPGMELESADAYFKVE